MTKKIVLIGAGSKNFALGILRDTIDSEGLEGSTIGLCDIDPAMLEAVYEATVAMVEYRQADLKIERSTDRRDLLPGADFVVTSIQIGGDQAWKLDGEIPWKYGIWQTVADTVGPGGLSRSLRIVPVMVEIAKDVEELCPDAWFINYTNPLTPISSGICRETNIKTVGLSGGGLRKRRRFMLEYLELEPEELWMIVAGPNHFLWVPELRVRGEDGYPVLRETLAKKGPVRPVAFKLWEMYGLYPFPGDLHLAEFAPGFLSPEADYGRKYGLKDHCDWPRVLDSEEAYDQRVERNRRIRQNVAEFYGEPHERGMALTIIDAMVNDRKDLLAVNIPNEGIVSNVADESILEVVGVVGEFGIRGVHVGSLPAAIARLVNANLAEQELIVQAALGGDRRLALQAFMADPLCRSIENTEKMLDELLAAHAAYLPRFQ